MSKMLKFTIKIVVLIVSFLLVVLGAFTIFSSDETVVVAKEFSGGSQCGVTYPVPSSQNIKNMFNILGIKIIDFKSEAFITCNACGCPSHPVGYSVWISKKQLILAWILGFK